MPFPMHDRALRYFLAVIRTGSIRAAAETLHVAASAISRQIAEMEAKCGSVLLERLPRGVAPTDAGRIVAEHAQLQADEALRLADRLKRLRGVREGTVRLCCGAGFLPDLLDNGLAGFSAAHPGIAYSVALDTTSGILGAVAAGEADIGLAYNPPAHPDIRSASLSRQPVAAIVPPGHKLAASPRPVPLRLFAAEPAALLPPDHGIRQLLGRVEADEGFRLTGRLETGSFELQRRFVMAGMGIAFLPEFAATLELRAGLLAALPLADPSLSQATTHLLIRAGRRLPEAVDGLVTWLTAHLMSLREARQT